MTLLIGVVLLVVAVLLSVRLRRAEQAAQLRAKAAARADLAKTGLTPSGNPLGVFKLQGAMHGVEVTLENGTSIRPPGARDGEGGYGNVCVVHVAAPLGDQLVCKLGEVDQMLGPLPTVPRLRTGHAPFDERYAIFMGKPREEALGSYRDAQDTSSIPWAQAPILDSLWELRLLLLRVQEGRVELVFPSFAIEDVGRAAALAAAVAQASVGKPVPQIERGRRTVKHQQRDTHTVIIVMYAVWAAALFFIIPGGMLLSLAPPLRALDAPFMCGANDRIIVCPAGDGEYGLCCAKQRDKSLLLHAVGSSVLFIAATGFIGVVFATFSGARSTRPAGPHPLS
jgi:hypothetical protein